MTDLAGLIERLEGASGPDREIDADLRWALDRQRAERAYWNGAMGMPRELPANAKLAGLGRLSVISAFPSLTASIDAAVALAERVLPGCRWRVEHLPASMTKGTADLSFWASCGLPGAQEAAYAITAPIALLIATLRALQATGEGEG